MTSFRAPSMRPLALVGVFVLGGASAGSARAAEDAEAGADGMLATAGNHLGMRFVRIPAGSFQMGSEGPRAFKDERPVQEVEIPEPVWMQTTKVTQRQWRRVMGTEPWEGGEPETTGPLFPATGISWNAAKAFCEKLSEKAEGEYRLSTEAEWEYAGRAGSQAEFTYGSDLATLSEHAWFEQNAAAAGEPPPTASHRRKPMRGASTTCTGTSKSGAKAGTAPTATRKRRRSARRSIGSSAATPGTAAGSTAAPRTATATSWTVDSAFTGSAWCGWPRSARANSSASRGGMLPLSWRVTPDISGTRRRGMEGDRLSLGHVR